LGFGKLIGGYPKQVFLTLLAKSSAGADAINISGLLNPKKLGNFKNRML